VGHHEDSEAAKEARDCLRKLLVGRDRGEGGAMPLIRRGVSIAADIKMGWRPRNPYSGAPIPLYYDYEQFYDDASGEKSLHSSKKIEIYLGPRIPNSL